MSKQLIILGGSVVMLGLVVAAASLGSVVMASPDSPKHQRIKHATESVAPFPAAQLGHKRHVIYLPALEDESLAKVELIIGRTLQQDCNHVSFSGQVSEQDLQGWGYKFYVVNQVGMPLSTLMACPPDYPVTERFVSMYHETGLLPYRSRMPVVVYAPADLQLRYRVWYTNNDIMDAMEQ